MPESGCQFSERFEDKTAVGHSGMRNGEFVGTHHRPAEEENIHINDPRPISDRTPAPQLSFHFLCGVEQLPWVERGLGFEDKVQEPWLVLKEHRRGFIDGGRADGLDRAGVERANGLVQVRLAIAEVGPEREEDSLQSHGENQGRP